MIGSIFKLSSLLLGVALLLTGHGLHLALVPLRASMAGWSSLDVGMLSSSYFAGFLTGCFVIPPLVGRVGHIRVFAALSAATTATVLALILSDNYWIWLLLRFSTGVTIVGLYLVIESWLNAEVSNEVRGGVIAAYTAIVLGGLALGQLLLNAASLEGERLFVIAAILVVLAALPVCLTRSSQPAQIPQARFSLRRLLQASRSAVVCAFIAGMVAGTFYGLGPLYGQQLGLEVPAISVMMALGITGGALSQLPLGRLSDRLDRRWVLFAAMCGGVVMASVALLVTQSWIPWVMLGFGACAMPIYALSLAHASDYVDGNDFMEVGTGLLLTNALGSIIGPLITARLMDWSGNALFFAFHLAIMAVGAVLLLFFIRSGVRPADHFSRFTPATTAAGQGAIELDPRSDDEAALAADEADAEKQN